MEHQTRRVKRVSPTLPVANTFSESVIPEMVEYLGTLRKELKMILSRIPDLTLLRWSGKKVRDPILDFSPNVSSSSSYSIWES